MLKGSGVNLLGRDWLSLIKLDWSRVTRSVKLNKADEETSNLDDGLVKKRLDDIISANSNIFRDKIGTINGYKARVYVKAGATPKFTKARSIPFALQDAVNQELEKLVSEGILKPVPFSSWASPIVIVPKPDGGVRICGDFKRTVNPAIETEVYPTPSNEEIFTKMQGGTRFSKIDLRQAYLQLELDEESKELLVVNTSKGLLQYQRMPYGIKPASSIFQCMMDNALINVPMTGTRTDDILVTGKNDQEHLENLERVMVILNNMGVTVKREKCKFFMDEVENLGHIISKDGLRVNPSKTEALNHAVEPSNIKELQSFIGGVNYYSKFIPNMASICKPLYSLLKKDVEWCWGVNQQKAFEALKRKLTSAPILEVYNMNLKIVLDCDASKYGIGAVLSHVYPNGDEKPVTYASRTLNRSEANYSQLDKEALAIIFAIKKFNQFLFARHFTLRCDNQALCRIFGPKFEIPVLAASRLIRWSIVLQSYDYDIVFRKTDNHCNADMLSRLPLKTASTDSTITVTTG